MSKNQEPRIMRVNHDPWRIWGLHRFVSGTLSGFMVGEPDIYLPFEAWEKGEDDKWHRFVSWRKVGVALPALCFEGHTYTADNDGRNYRVHCAKCKGTGFLDEEWAEDNQFPQYNGEPPPPRPDGRKTCWMCGKRGWHPLPSPEKYCASLFIWSQLAVLGDVGVHVDKVIRTLDLHVHYGRYLASKNIEASAWEQPVISFTTLLREQLVDWKEGAVDGVFSEEEVLQWIEAHQSFGLFLQQVTKIGRPVSERMFAGMQAAKKEIAAFFCLNEETDR